MLALQLGFALKGEGWDVTVAGHVHPGDFFGLRMLSDAELELLRPPDAACGGASE